MSHTKPKIDKNIKIIFEQIYVNNYARLVRFASLYLNDEHEAENVVQDTFVDLWNNRDNIEYIEQPLSFLLKVAKFKSIDSIRKKDAQQRKITNFSDSLSSEQRYEMINLEMLDTDKICRELKDRRVMDAIEMLPDQCKKIFIMSKLEGIKQKEIAAKLGISVNSVETQMGIAYKKLRDILKDKTLSLFELAILMLLS